MELTIAVPKGRLEQQVGAYLEAHGIDVAFSGRELMARDRTGTLRFLLVKNHDLPTYVGHGIAGLGICGDDLLAESRHRFYRLATLPFGASRMCLVTARGASPGYDRPGGVKVATKYPAQARAFFHNRGIPVEVVRLSGSVELAPVLGLAPFIVDIVETGRTLDAHDLVVVAELAPIRVRLIANPAYYKVHYRGVEAVVARLTGNGGGA